MAQVRALEPGGFADILDRALNSFGRAFQLCACDTQGRNKDDCIHDRTRQQTIFARRDAYPSAGLLLPREPFSAASTDFDACDHSTLAGFGDVRKLAQT